MKRFLLPILFICLFAAGCATSSQIDLRPEAMQNEFNKGKEAYDAGNYEQAFAILNPLAQDGYAEAQYYVGLMYSQGQGTILYPQESISKWEDAARQGHSQAMYALAMAYTDGKGVATESPDMTHYWVNKSAESDYMHVKSWNYDLYHENYFIFSPNRWEVGAYRFPGGDYRRVKDNFHAHYPGLTNEQMTYEMAQNYKNGASVAQDLGKARVMFRDVATTENPYQADAQYELGVLGH